MPNANVFDSRDYSADASPHVECVHDLAGPASYATSGVDPTLKTALDLADEPFLVEGVATDGSGYSYNYVYSTKKGIIRDEAGAEVGNASDQSGKTYRLKIKAAKSA